MLSLILASLLWIGLHIGVAGTRLRDRVVAALGTKGYGIAFSLGSVVSIAWLVGAYNAAPYIGSWGQLEGWKPAALILMVPAVLLVVIGLMTPNPTSVAQEKRAAEPPQGIVRVTRHPFLWGVAIWAFVHLVGNGDLASLVFFGTWVVTALVGTVSIDAKRARSMGPEWATFKAATSNVPFAGPGALAGIRWWQWAAGLAVYALILGGHAHLFGVSPMPVR